SRGHAGGEEIVEAVERDEPRLRLPARLPVYPARKTDRPAEKLEAPPAQRLGALEQRPRLAEVLAPERGEARQERFAIARARLEALSPARRREERPQPGLKARPLSPARNVQRLKVRHAASSPRSHSSGRRPARRVQRGSSSRRAGAEPSVLRAGRAPAHPPPGFRPFFSSPVEAGKAARRPCTGAPTLRRRPPSSTSRSAPCSPSARRSASSGAVGCGARSRRGASPSASPPSSCWGRSRRR